MTKLAVVTPHPEPLPHDTPARRALASAIAAKASAQQVHAEAAAAVTATSDLIAQEAIARQQLDDMNRRNAEFVAEWAKSGATGKPDIADPVMIDALQHDLNMAAASASAARLALPDLQATMEVARAEATAARERVEEAVRAVLVEEATVIDAGIAALLERATALRAQLYGLGLHSQRIPRGAQLTSEVRRLIERYMAEPNDAAVNASQGQWRALAERLVTDHTATIQPEYRA
jgi:hypothetical protein